MAEAREVDVVILGGGINGVGLFRDLCEQGITCLLVDKADFGGGTSAAPSRLIHGGLKYLETGELGLVAQSTLERNLLLKNAAHLVTPLPTLIPIFSWTRGLFAALRTLFGSTQAPRSRGAMLIKIGLSMYDFYGAKHRVMPRHHLLWRGQALKELPALTPSIVASAIYYDAQISHPERLVLELIQDGLDASALSAAMNYTTLSNCHNGLLSFTSAGGEPLTVRPKVVINAAGPWIDKVNAMLNVPSTMIGGTKGSHILLKHDELVKNLAGRMVYYEADDGRICLVFDYFGLALVGSTDIPADNPDDVVCDAAEIEYLLASVNSLMPSLQVVSDDIVYAYSGIRPLPASDASAPGLISRDHSAPVNEPDATRPFAVISLVGGKWTTFRGFAEEVADTVLQRLDKHRTCSTQDMPIGGGRDFPADASLRNHWLAQAAHTTGLTEARLEQLLKRYGSKALNVAEHRGDWTDEQRLPDSEDYSLLEIDYIATNECVEHLIDIVLRRTTLAIAGTLTLGDLQQIAEVADVALGWGPSRTTSELDAVAVELAEKHHVHL